MFFILSYILALIKLNEPLPSNSKVQTKLLVFTQSSSSLSHGMHV